MDGSSYSLGVALLKLVEYMSMMLIIGLFTAIIMRVNLVTNIIDASEDVSRGDFQIGMFILLALLLTIAFAVLRK